MMSESVKKSPLSQQDVIDMDTSLSRRTSFIPKPLPKSLEPLTITDLYSHVCSILTFQEKQWQLPGASENVIYCPPDSILPCNYQESQIYLQSFLNYFINVKNFVKFEKVFRDNQETSDLIITHCLSFAWTLLNRESIDGMPFDTLDLVIEDFLVIVMKFVRIFSRLDTLASSIGQKHGIRLILRTMQKYPYCMQLQINSSACLANLASAESNRNVMLEDGCIKLVLGNMEKFMNEPAVQAEICATLANLACHEANAMYIVRNGGCTMIIKAMRRHGDQIDFQIQAFHALASLGKHAKEILDRESFVSIVVKCVTQHEDEVDLVSAAWHALGSLANSGVSIVQHKAHLIGMLFASMRRFNKNHKFQITACFALAHVFFNHRDPHVDDSAVTSHQGVECLLDTMKRFPEQESLQTTALFALGSIVMKSASHRESVLKYDGIPLIISAMGRTYEPKDEEQRLDVDVEEGHTPEPILYSRGNNRVQCSKPLLLQLFGSVSLLNLSECVKCRDRIIDLGGIHYIFQASKRVSEQKDLWYIVYYIFSKFTRCGDDKTVYMRPKGVPTLGELSKIALCNTLTNGFTLQTSDSTTTLFESENPKTTAQMYNKSLIDYQTMLLKKVEILRLPKLHKDEMMLCKPCKECGKACYLSYIRHYGITRERRSFCYPLCSLACAQMDKNYQTRPTFYYSGSIEID